MKTAYWWLAGSVLALAIVAYAGRYQLRSIMVGTVDALQDPNVRAFLDMIGADESHGRYDILFGGGTFSDFSTHPNVHVPFTDPRTGEQTYSTAAGKYQILYRTWKALTLIPGAPQDFGPAAQDWFAVQLLKARGALAPLMDGDFDTALQKASPEWASLPYATYGQPTKSYQKALNEFLAAGGQVNNGSAMA